MPLILITDIMSVCIYVDDYATAFDFYAHTLGLEKSKDAGENACFFRLNDNPNAIYLEGGYTRSEIDERSTTLSFMLKVDNAPMVFEELKAAGVRMVQEKAQNLGDSNYWFRCYDPTGNIIEFVSSGSNG